MFFAELQIQNLLAWNWNFCDLRRICESCGIFSWGKRPRAFNNFDEAGVKVLEEKKSLTKAIFAVRAVLKIRRGKNSGLYGIWAHDLYDTGAEFYQLS